MLKQVLDFSILPVHVNTRHKQLIVNDLSSEKRKVIASIPIEDIGAVIVGQQKFTVSGSCLKTLSENGAIVVFCDDKYMPISISLPSYSHYEIVKRANSQISMSQPRKKRLWQQIVREKISVQSQMIPYNKELAKQLKNMIADVDSGDTTNREALAARTYWKAWRGPTDFQRNPDGSDFLNVALNYGYAIIRATIARNVVGFGLLPMLGLFHQNKSNYFALADDLMEPIRPYIDYKVRLMEMPDSFQFSKESKNELVQIVNDSVTLEGEKMPLQVALRKYVVSYVKACEDLSQKLSFPKFEIDKRLWQN